MSGSFTVPAPRKRRKWDAFWKQYPLELRLVGQPLDTFFIDVRRGSGIPEAIPSMGPVAAAALALLLVLAAADRARSRRRGAEG